MQYSAGSEEFLLKRKFVRRGKPVEKKHAYPEIYKAIWIYFALLIFEGALRKWVLPGLSNPLLLIRDPIALYIVYRAYQRKIFPNSIYFSGIIWVGFIALITAILFGHGNLFVALYGARILLLHFPLVFIIGRVFNRDDVIMLGKIVLVLTVLMAVITALQFYSPQSAWINRGVGGIEGAGFSGAMGYFRPPGTFSFTNGNTVYFAFAAPFILFFLLNSQQVNKIILVMSILSLLAAIPLTLSRSVFFSVAFSVLFAMMAVLTKPKYISKMMLALTTVAFAFAVLSQTSFFTKASTAFMARFEGANETEGGIEGVLADRYLGGLIGALTNTTATIPPLGLGIGMGSSVGGALLSGGESRGRVLSEGDWGRWIGELGPILGLSLISLRLGLSAKVLSMSYKQLKKGDLLPWLILSFFLLFFPQGDWAQPTSLGFCISAGGLQLASLRNRKIFHQRLNDSQPVLTG